MSQQDDFRNRIYGDESYFNDLPPAGYEGIGGIEAQLAQEQDVRSVSPAGSATAAGPATSTSTRGPRSRPRSTSRSSTE